MQNLITGIQQCGIGTPDAHEAALYYKNLFGLDALVFDDTAEAVLMKAYTGNEVQKRRAILTMNMQGGGGFELWQFISRQPEECSQPLRMGDLGLFAIKMKCPDVVAAYQHFSQVDHCSVSALQKTPHDQFHFWLTDKYGQVFNMVQATGLFKNNGNICAGVCGAVIGVSHLATSLFFYKNLLGLDIESYNTTTTNVGPITYTGEEFHSVLLQKAAAANGAFSQLLGDIQIELIESKDYTGKKIFHNRYWGDIGFIHLCFDVLDMERLKEKADELNYPFSVDSKNSFVMENAGGRFCYVEDPDGTLIELVETHAVPIFKKMGWYLNLQKRKKDRPLPKWMIGMMGLTKIK